MRTLGRIAVVFAAGVFAVGCAADDEAYSESGGTDEVGLGEVVGEAGARDPRQWTEALRCKPIPMLPALTSPEIVVSLDGLTLHLRDRAGGYDKVFAIGPGALENGRSLTPTSESAPRGVFYTGTNTAEVSDGQWGYYYPCRIWHEDRGVRTPVFAGLPFIRLAGPPTAGFGIHGPIDNFTAPSGGSLRRGFVSHGCVRMSAADIVEVYARIRGRAKVPVRIQQAVERTNDGLAVDTESRWIGSECAADSDCNYANGLCRKAAGAALGTCTQRCTMSCPDRVGQATTFCVRDPSPAAMSAGICVPRADSVFNNSCQNYRARLTFTANAPRPDASLTANVCRPAP
jgi:hypothetical protein